MARFAMLFPGQGSQSVGMLSALLDSHSAVPRTLAEASDALGYDMVELVTNGPEERLNQTEYTQPALLACSIAIWRAWQEAWQEKGARDPAYLAGHSLGEYSALVVAGALDFADALRLTRERGRAMQAAMAGSAGGMAAVLGLDDDGVREVCAEARKAHQSESLTVSPANFNAPGQVVIAGDQAAVDTAADLARERGAKRVMPLQVSVASHCALMKPAAEQLTASLQHVAISAPKLPVLHNVDAQPREHPDDIRDALVAQLAEPVCWSDTMRSLLDANCELFIECGPGRVLAGLTRRMDKSAQCIALSAPEGFSEALARI